MPVDQLRNVRDSLYRRASDLFTAPPSGSGLSAFTVYSEPQLRAVQAGTLTPTRPCVFLTSQPTRPAEIALPLVVVEVTLRGYPFELGNESGSMIRAWFHCFGRQRGESSTLAWFLRSNLKPLKIYDYSDPDSPVEKETALLAYNIDVEEGPALRDELRQQGAFDYWTIVAVRGWTRDVS